MQILIDCKSTVAQKNQVLNGLTHFKTGNSKVDIESSVKLLEVNIDNQLSFNQHIINKSSIFQSTKCSENTKNFSQI